MLSNRRTFLDLSLRAAAATLLGEKLWAASKEPELDIQTVIRVYRELFEYINSEIKAALKENPNVKIIIEVGEVHNSTNSSLLCALMIQNIAWRLGIKECGFELCSENLNNLLPAGYEKIIKAASVEDKGVNVDFSLRVLEQVADGTILPIKVPEKYDERFKFEAYQLTIVQAMMYGFNIRANDPLQNVDPDVSKLTISELITNFKTREPGMIGAVNNVNDHCVNFNGNAHESTVTEGLRKNPAYHVIPINLGLGVNLETIAKLRETDKASAEFFDHRHSAASKFYTPKIPLSPQLSPAQAMAMVWLAAADHMAKGEKPQITKAGKDTIDNAIKKCVPNIPGISGPEKH